MAASVAASASTAAKAAAGAAAAASRFKGRYAVHPLLPASAQLIADSCKEHIKPSWAPRAQELLVTWRKIATCMPKYAEFLKKTNKKDLKRIHVFMNDEAQARLGAFYLCCAFHLRREEIEAAGSDAEQLMRVANAVSTEEVEPFFEACRTFVADYDEGLHKQLDNTTIWREVEDSLFWHHSFEVAAQKQYAAYQRAVLPPEAAWPDREDMPGLEAVLADCSRAVAEESSQRELAEDVFRGFLESSSTPVKASIRAALIDHGIIWGEVNYRGLDAPQEKSE